MKLSLTLLFVFAFCTFSFSQNVGSKVAFTSADGINRTGIVKEFSGNQYRIKYDGIDFEAWLVKEQFSVLDDTPATNAAGQPHIGSKVTFNAVDGKTYTGVVKDINGNNYKIQYDGFDFTAWLTRDQFTRAGSGTSTVYLPGAQQGDDNVNKGTRANPQDLQSIFDFGKANGWASTLQQDKFNRYLARLSAEDKNKLMSFLNQANTSSARFFVLKSLLHGDDFPILQRFIGQLNGHPESYQRDKCLVSTRHSIIQQWEFSCSVTVVQTYLGDLCPRYAWDIKQVNDYDVADNNPDNPMAQQQKMLLERYGGVASARGDYSGKSIPINDGLNELVGNILGTRFHTVQVTEPLTTVFTNVRTQLDAGYDIPLLIGFVGSQARHFILVMNYRQSQNGYQYLIYDPWDGVCDYVNETDIQQGSLTPLLTRWRISVDYYYLPD